MMPLSRHILEDYIDEKSQTITRVSNLKEFLEDARRHIMQTEEEIRRMRETLEKLREEGCHYGKMNRSDIDRILQKNGFWKGTIFQWIVVFGVVCGWIYSYAQLTTTQTHISKQLLEVKPVLEEYHDISARQLYLVSKVDEINAVVKENRSDMKLFRDVQLRVVNKLDIDPN